MSAQSAAERNVEVVRRVYEAWAHDRFPAPAGVLDPNVEYVNPASAVEPGTRRGVAAFARAVERTLEGWETWEMTPERFEARDDQVAVLISYRARGRASGVEVDGRESALWTLRDARVVRYEWFEHPAGGFEALARG